MLAELPHSTQLVSSSLLSLLSRIDDDLVERTRKERCPHCGGPLHRSDYTRKPRGAPDDADVPEDCLRRRSLCCGWEGCRRRCLPPSCLFLGRRVYFGCAVLLILTARSGDRRRHSARELRRRFGVSWTTVKRWIAYFRDEFPGSRIWQGLRGHVGPEVRSDALPESLVTIVVQEAACVEQGLARSLVLLSGCRAEWMHRI